MGIWSSIEAVGNPQLVSHYGAALEQANKLGVASAEFVVTLMNEQRDLSSKAVHLGGMLAGVSGGVTEAHARGNQTYTAPNIAVTETSRG